MREKVKFCSNRFENLQGINEMNTLEFFGRWWWRVPAMGPSHRMRGGGPGHYNDVVMGTVASQITSLTIVYSTVYSGADQRKHQSSVSLAFVRGIHRSPVNFPHKWPVSRKMFPFDDVIMRGGSLSPWDLSAFSVSLLSNFELVKRIKLGDSKH